MAEPRQCNGTMKQSEAGGPYYCTHCENKDMGDPTEAASRGGKTKPCPYKICPYCREPYLFSKFCNCGQ